MENNMMNLDELANTDIGNNSNSFDMTSGIIMTQNTDNPTRRVIPVSGGSMNSENLKPVDINALLPKKTNNEQSIFGTDVYAALDEAVDREIASITERQNELFKTMKQEVDAMQDNADTQNLDDCIETGESTCFDVVHTNDSGLSAVTATHDAMYVKHDSSDYEYQGNATDSGTSTSDMTITSIDTNILGYVDNGELFDDDPDSDDDDNTTNIDQKPSDEELISSIKEQVRNRIDGDRSRKNIDLTKFTFAKKALSAQRVMKLAVTGHQNVADWVLPAANKTISMTGLSGPEILKLDANNSNRNRMNTFKDMYSILYKHVVDANKPEFEVWLKQMRFTDLQHIYFAAYMATFSGSSFTNYSCPHCSNVFIHDIEFKDLVKYKDDKAKERIHNLMKKDSTSTNPDTYEAELVQISEKYAFAIRTPSIWNTVIEIATLSDKFLESHADLIDLIAYIDGIYLIDYETNQLIPVDTKPDPDDMGKTVARRVKSMYDIISTLSSDEYSTLRSAITATDENVDEITYKLPACTCPKCNKMILENDSITPEQLLFTRHQLAAIANMSN